VNKKKLIVWLIMLTIVGGGFIYRFTHLSGSKTEEKKKQDGNEQEGHEKETNHKGDNEHNENKRVKMAAEIQKQSGVVTETAKLQKLGGTISSTGKVEVNADRIAHVSPRISGKIVTVRSTLGETVAAGQPLASLDSVELGEAINRYRQSRTKLTLAQANMERIKSLVDRKIAARKDILQAETEYRTIQAEVHTDEERLSLYGVSVSEASRKSSRRPLLPVRSPISGVITEKHAIVGELADPSKNLYTVADLSSVWVQVDINEKELSQIHKGQQAYVTVGAFPDIKFKGRITYIADLVNDATRTVKARVEIPNAGRKLKPEMFATVEIVLPSNTAPVLSVPTDTLQDVSGRKTLFVTENGTDFEARVVETGRSVGGMIEINSGLKEGERYVVKGSFLLKSEMKKGDLGEHGH